MKRIFSYIMAVALTLMATGCKDDEESAVSDTSYYNTLACTVLEATGNIYNQNIAGTNVTPSDLHVDAPHGGTVVISGSVSNDNNNLTRVDLNYTFDNVRWLWTSNDGNYSTDVYITGVIHEVGSFRASDNYRSLSTSSDSLRMTGSVNAYSSKRNVDELGKISIVSDVNKYNGDMFGHTVNN